MEMNNDSRKSNNKYLIGIIIFLLMANVILLWQFFTKKNEVGQLTETRQTLTADKESLTAELNKTVGELNELKEDNQLIQGQLENTQKELEARKRQIEGMISKGQYEEARKALVSLRQEMMVYKAQIDSLRTANAILNDSNRVLKDVNSDLNSTLTDEKSKNENLVQQNSSLSSKVAAGSVLRAGSVKAIPMKVKGSGKEVEVNRASSAKRIKTCFTLLENRVADRGNKTVYVRVLGPNNMVMSSNTETITVDGQPTRYSAKETVKYDNKDTDVCIYYSPDNATFAKGNYTVEIYSDNHLIGSTKITLK
jgi:hypothetical protein